ncbi:MAG: flagellar hook-associated protein FlgL [Candidatus Gastranaerophilales bacterium]|nr:flagellar hook-associated protein FlgL [Candidatus Gastranaerophilales bacterium]
MYVRTTTLGTSDRLVSQMMANQSALLNTQIQLSSQKRINRPSDDCVDAAQILSLGRQQDKISTYKDNINTAREQINMLDSSLAQVINVAQRANELAVQGSNGVYSKDQLGAIKTEIDQITASVMDFANTQYNGQYIFAGNNVSSPAYTKGADGSIVYQGSSGSQDSGRTMEIMEGTYLALNVNGSDVFGSFTPSDTTVDPAIPSQGSGLFKALGDLSESLALDPPDSQKISESIGTIKDGLNTINNVRTEYGSYASTRLNMTESYLTDLSLSVTEQRSNLEDLDMIQAITDYSNENYAYQASLSSVSKTMQISLLNYI